jgi:hypothetical protein
LETIYGFPRREFPNRLPNLRNIFYFIGDLRGQNKADVDALAKHEEFFNGEFKKTKIFTRFIKGNKRK